MIKQKVIVVTNKIVLGMGIHLDFAALIAQYLAIGYKLVRLRLLYVNSKLHLQNKATLWLGSALNLHLLFYNLPEIYKNIKFVIMK